MCYLFGVVCSDHLHMLQLSTHLAIRFGPMMPKPPCFWPCWAKPTLEGTKVTSIQCLAISCSQASQNTSPMAPTLAQIEQC